MEFLFFCLIIAIIYFAALFAVIKVTVDKLNAYSAMLGAGVVNMFAGFILHVVVKLSGTEGYWNGGKYLEYPAMYYVLLFGFLIMGLSGVVMIAVDLMHAIREVRSSCEAALEKKAEKPSPVQQEKIPAWKQIQMDNE